MGILCNSGSNTNGSRMYLDCGVAAVRRGPTETKPCLKQEKIPPLSSSATRTAWRLPRPGSSSGSGWWWCRPRRRRSRCGPSSSTCQNSGERRSVQKLARGAQSTPKNLFKRPSCLQGEKNTFFPLDLFLAKCFIRALHAQANLQAVKTLKQH